VNDVRFFGSVLCKTAVRRYSQSETRATSSSANRSVSRHYYPSKCNRFYEY